MDVSFFFLRWQLQLCYHVSQLHIHSMCSAGKNDKHDFQRWLLTDCDLQYQIKIIHVSRSQRKLQQWQNALEIIQFNWGALLVCQIALLKVSDCWRVSESYQGILCTSNLKHYYTESAFHDTRTRGWIWTEILGDRNLHLRSSSKSYRSQELKKVYWREDGCIGSSLF